MVQPGPTHRPKFSSRAGYVRLPACSVAHTLPKCSSPTAFGHRRMSIQNGRSSSDVSVTTNRFCSGRSETVRRYRGAGDALRTVDALNSNAKTRMHKRERLITPNETEISCGEPEKTIHGGESVEGKPAERRSQACSPSASSIG